MKKDQDVWAFYAEDAVAPGSPSRTQYFWAAKVLSEWIPKKIPKKSLKEAVVEVQGWPVEDFRLLQILIGFIRGFMHHVSLLRGLVCWSPLFWRPRLLRPSIFYHAEQTFLDAFDSTGLTILAVGVVATAVAANNDQQMEQNWGNNQRMPTNFSAIGNFWGGGGALIPIVGQLIFDTQNGIVSTEGQAESFLIIQPIKYGVGRPRPCANVPNCNGGTDDLSFPSGHTTSAFAFASSMGVEYPMSAFTCRRTRWESTRD